ncbi:fasciclin domain-containing protein [Siphonobacter sp. SORGH_AS_0500]|uniref:fasciclin domain-containing protein n=1 Tax=Siphonobacter sp. SORGH_AS_0500 TaxID=1864824 RepID=UPI000CB083D0|nr:fasciclin domain-containing protein [Siphonobacter sp. SORGH_AS_0500]MDR6195051.1 putative surface protein with fasciclin (FAS1) repeats [Siphonobacter sp. SORGH_AS_0500]PKK38412.1 hypothetical protein BWI96_01155 [Siphonobacter sp. SORGH_AS_0500]
MMKKIGILALFLYSCAPTQSPSKSTPSTTPASTDTPAVASGGRTNISDQTSQSNTHTILAKALKESGFANTLKGAGPFTFFAPTDSAFYKSDEMPALTQPQEVAKLRKILAYHIVPGMWYTQNFQQMMDDKGIKRVELKTMTAQLLTVTKQDTLWIITDANGNRASIIDANLKRSNGVVHSINALLEPK